MAIMTVVAIVAGLACAAIEFYVTTMGSKSSLHRKAHLLSGLAYMGLVYMIWILR